MDESKILVYCKLPTNILYNNECGRDFIPKSDSNTSIAMTILLKCHVMSRVGSATEDSGKVVLLIDIIVN